MKIMDATNRMKIVDKLREAGRIYVGKDMVTFRNGLIYIETADFPRHPFDSHLLLDNPMTWDTFMHIYLLDKGGVIIR